MSGSGSRWPTVSATPCTASPRELRQALLGIASHRWCQAGPALGRRWRADPRWDRERSAVGALATSRPLVRADYLVHPARCMTEARIRAVEGRTRMGVPVPIARAASVAVAIALGASPVSADTAVWNMNIFGPPRAVTAGI